MGGKIDIRSELGLGSPSVHRVSQGYGAPSPHGGLDVEDFFDVNIFNSIVAGLPEDTCKLALTAFSDELSSSAEKVRQAANIGNLEALEKSSHLIMSIAGTFGASALQSVATSVNSDARGGDHRQAYQQAKELATICDLTLGAFQRLNDFAG